MRLETLHRKIKQVRYYKQVDISPLNICKKLPRNAHPSSDCDCQPSDSNWRSSCRPCWSSHWQCDRRCGNLPLNLPCAIRNHCSLITLTAVFYLGAVLFYRTPPQAQNKECLALLLCSPSVRKHLDSGNIFENQGFRWPKTVVLDSLTYFRGLVYIKKQCFSRKKFRKGQSLKN